MQSAKSTYTASRCQAIRYTHWRNEWPKHFTTGCRQKAPFWKRPAGGTWCLESVPCRRFRDGVIGNPTMTSHAGALCPVPLSTQPRAVRRWVSEHRALSLQRTSTQSRRAGVGQDRCPWDLVAPWLGLSPQHSGIGRRPTRKALLEHPLDRRIESVDKARVRSWPMPVQWPEEKEEG